MTRALACLCLAAIGLLATGCFNVSAEVSSIEQTLDALHFPGAGVGVGAAGGKRKFDRELHLEIGKNVLKLVTSLRLERVSFEPTTGVRDLSFVDELSLTALGDGTLPDLVAARYERGGAQSPSELLEAVGAEVELLPYLQKARPVLFTATVEPPARDWSLGITLEFSAESVDKL